MPLDREQIEQRLAQGNGEGDLSGLDLTGADLSRMDLRGVDLSRTDLSAADLRWAVLEGADLHSSVLRRADARWAVMRGTNLRQADLARANLGWADVTGADLTGAYLDETSLENVDLPTAITGVPTGRQPVTAPVAVGRTAAPAAGPLALPEVGWLGLLGGVLAALGLVHLWGWLFRRAYYGAFDIAPGDVLDLSDGANLATGLLDVGWLTLKTIAAGPLLLTAVALVLAAVLAVPVLLVLFGEQLLSDERVRSDLRPAVMVALFLGYAALFFFVLLPALEAGGSWLVAQALPPGGGLRAVFDLVLVGGWLTKLGFVLLLVLAGYVAWIGWRLLSRWLMGYEVPLEWRLRYPALNDAVAAAREARAFRRSEPLSAEERRRALAALAVGLALLGTLLAGTGRVFAYGDMCDGGQLPRVQLYLGEPPDQPPSDRLMCERLLVESEDHYYVFFPHQTEQTGDDIFSRQPNVRRFAKDEDLSLLTASGDRHACPTCAEALPPDERRLISYRFLVDPTEVSTRGTVDEISGALLLITPETPDDFASVRVEHEGGTAEILINGQPGTLEDIAPGDVIEALGQPAGTPEAPILNARVVEVTPAEAQPLPEPTFNVDLRNPREAITISGSDWVPGNRVEIAVVDEEGLRPVDTVVVGPDGTFSAPIQYHPGLPTGPQFELQATDPDTGQSTRAPWLAAPPPTVTPSPTVEIRPTPEIPTPAVGTPTPSDQATATPAAPPTNTPFPTAAIPGQPGAGAPVDCDPDEYEYDSGRGFQKEIYVSFGETPEAQTHSFCPAGDVDLLFFRVKAGRWYRVFTTNLAAGVDTVLAVGDLSNSTPCQPAGCWNDDRTALTYESEVIFKAVEDDVALVTVDNRGTRYATEATYDIAVVEFQPQPTATPTPGPTPTVTQTPLPRKDPFEGSGNDRCTQAYETLDFGRYEATIDSGSDEDWYRTITLDPGRYRVTMFPPDDQDYDLQLRYDSTSTRTDCRNVQETSAESDDRAEVIEWGVSTRQDFVFRVYPAYSIFSDPFEPYVLVFEPINIPTPTDTPTATATVTATPTITPTPTATPGLEGLKLPPTGTPTSETP